MAKILLDYFFPISVIESIPAASTAFLKQAIVVAKPKTGQEGNIGQLFECTTMVEVAARTNNTNAQQLFNAGMTKVFVMLADALDLSAYLADAGLSAWTILISDDFIDSDLTEVTVNATAATRKIQDITYTAKALGTTGNSITISYVGGNTGGAASVSVASQAIAVSIEAGVTTAATIATAIANSAPANALVTRVVDVGDETDPQVVTGSPLPLQNGANATTSPGSLEVGTFDGVVGYSSSDANVCQLFGSAENRVGFYHDVSNGAKNMFFAFGKLLSNLSNWSNQQYVSMPYNDAVDVLGEANSLFDDRVSFALNDTEFGNRLALFSAGGKAIAAPYISKNLRVDLQSRGLQWVAANQPSYTLTNAALLEQRLQEDVINAKYIDTKWIDAGTIEVKLIQDNFVANGYIDIAEPKALWRIFGEMRSTL